MAESVALDREVMALIEQALSQPEPQRESWLTNACEQRPELASRAQELLKLVTQTTHVAGPEEPLARLTLQTQVGAYRVTEIIGQGGMGVVYAGERSDGQFEHRVAIKFAHPSLVSPSLLARFTAERQILAGLSHPNIAQLLDGGDVDGRPYIVLEFVEGRPLTAVRDPSLVNFLQLCEAVAFAHNNGVLHRDLKPGNVLVSADGIVKLLDFGVAKIFDELTSHDDLTRAQTAAPLTPNYTAPERLRGERATQASDIYSLGVVLYEMVTGNRPFDLNGLTHAEAATVIEGWRIDQVGQAGNQVSSAESGGTAISDADLRAIIGKAMHADAQQRYGSVSELVEDLKRWQTGEAVQARGTDRRYLLKKFISNHRLPVAFGAVASLAIIAALVVTLVALTDAQQQRQLAEQEAANANAAVKFLTSALEATNPMVGEKAEPTVLDILRFAEERVGEEFAEQPGIHLELLQRLAPIYENRGQQDSARRISEKALALTVNHFPDDFRQWAIATENLGASLWRGGEFQAALDLFTRAIARTERLQQQGAVEDAAFVVHVLATFENQRGLAGIELDLLDQANEAFTSALALRKKSGEYADVTMLASAYNNLALVPTRRSDYPTALRFNELAVQEMRSDPDYRDLVGYYVTLSNMADTLVSLEQFDAAETAYAEALPGLLRFYGPTAERTLLAGANYGRALAAQGLHTQAIDFLTDKATEFDRQASSLGRSSVLTQLGRLHCQAGVVADGLAAAQAALQHREAHYPAEASLRLESQAVVGYCMLQAGRIDEAHALLPAAYAGLRQSRGEQADLSLYADWVAEVEQQLALDQAAVVGPN